MSQPSLNKVFFIGFLTEKPIIRYVPSGIPVVNFSLAVHRGYSSPSKKETLDYFNIIAWRELAVFCHDNLGRGSWVWLEGRLQVRVYQDKGGQKRKVYEVIAHEVKPLNGLEADSLEENQNLPDVKEDK
ncbi:MAG: single-strand DNA-binding protein [Candidatus Atribacteria bacterium]|nr:single-strand DNA-binding protein [Candidatus Atribacteria bacterium]